MRHSLTILLVAASVGVVASGGTASAAPISISLDTSALIGGDTGPYYLDFQLIDGDGLANTAVALSNFDFFGGAAGDPPILDGGATGSASSAATLSDTGFFNGLLQEFVPGTALSFVLDFTSAGSDPTPDQFSFSILNADLFGIGSGPAGALLTIDFFASPIVATYAGTREFGDPLVGTPSVRAVPEPSTLMLLGLGAALAGLRGRRRSGACDRS